MVFPVLRKNCVKTKNAKQTFVGRPANVCFAVTRPFFAAQRLIIMVKEPRLGAVKTRLGREIGAAAATGFYRAVSANLIRRLGGDPRWRLVLAVAPDGALASGGWPGPGDRVPQGRGDIGERMLRLLRRQGAGRTILIGSDIPGVRAEHIAEAFGSLTRHELVFGPADDGGFWLVGGRRQSVPAGLFSGVRWSSPHALADTLKNCDGRTVSFAATLSDVDDAQDYTRQAQAGRCVTPLGGISPSRGSPVR